MLLVAKLEISNWGAEVTVPKISIKLRGRKRIYPKISIRNTYSPLLNEKLNVFNNIDVNSFTIQKYVCVCSIYALHHVKNRMSPTRPNQIQYALVRPKMTIYIIILQLMKKYVMFMYGRRLIHITLLTGVLVISNLNDTR